MFEFTFCSFLDWRVLRTNELRKEFKDKADIKLRVLAGIAERAHEVEVPEEEPLSGRQVVDEGCFGKCVKLCIPDMGAFKPRKIDMFFRWAYLVVYMIVLLILFTVPVSNEYE